MIENINTGVHIVDTEAALKKISAGLEENKVVAVDLEADSMYHFKEKVCLVQLATKTASFAVDPLQIKDLSALKPLFSNPAIKKIFHGADYDVRSLYRDFQMEIKNLFDTELACRFLGFKETGLDTVLKERFNLRLNKKFQKKDWSQRPLPADMIEYAAIDAIYLIPLAEILEKEINKKGRMKWIQEECENLCKVRHVSGCSEPLFLKFKGAGKLDSRDLAVLEALLSFRKTVAEKKDKPLFKIIRNESLLKITRATPATLKRLKEVHALSETQVDMYGKVLIEIVKKALKIPKKNQPVYPRKKGPVLEYAVTKRIKSLKSWRDATAQELELEPPMLFPKSLLTAIAVLNPRKLVDLNKIKEMKNWHKREFGGAILKVLQKA
jgi:ribonuclease D